MGPVMVKRRYQNETILLSNNNVETHQGGIARVPNRAPGHTLSNVTVSSFSTTLLAAATRVTPRSVSSSEVRARAGHSATPGSRRS
jgi:hypothetical protein